MFETPLFSGETQEVNCIGDAARVVMGSGSKAEGTAQLIADSIACRNSVLDGGEGGFIEMSVGKPEGLW